MEWKKIENLIKEAERVTLFINFYLKGFIEDEEFERQMREWKFRKEYIEYLIKRKKER